jgi:acetolactate synthase I/II/III large subunit
MTATVHSNSSVLPARATAADSVADHLVNELRALGISTYFGVPGGAIEPLFNALARQQRLGLVRLVPMRSEAGAGFAADGYYRATGRMAVCTATTGPGISNLITATMAADADRIPLLVLTPQVAQSKRGRGAFQDSSADSFFGACTRFSTIVSHPEQLGHKLARAFAVATGAPCGPVHLSFPSDVLAGPWGAERRSAGARASIPQAVDEGAVELLLEALLSAKDPIFYVGDDAGTEAHRVCKAAGLLNARVVTSPGGKRWIGHYDASYVGVAGFSGHPAAAEALRRADLVVAFGATFDEWSTNAWSSFPEIPIYSVDRHTDHAHRLPSIIPVVSPPEHVIRRILERIAYQSEPAIRARTVPPPQLVMGGSGGAVHPADLMRWLSSNLPSDVVVHVDAGSGFGWSTRHLVRPKPDTYRIAIGLSTMAWAIGAVIGAAVGRPRRTLCVAGDGSMLMSSLELTVAVEHNLPVTYVVMNDSSYGMVRYGQRLAGAEPIAHELPHVRFDQVARACGAEGLRVESLEDLDCVPREYIAADDAGPCLIDVRVDANAAPPFADRPSGLTGG